MKKAFFIIIIIITMKEQTWKMKIFPVHRILKALVIHSKHNSVLHIQIVKGNVLILSASLSASLPASLPDRQPRSATSSIFGVGEWTFVKFIEAILAQYILCAETHNNLYFWGESRLCARQCWATKPYLSCSCIVLVSCQLQHASVWTSLNPFESIADGSQPFCVYFSESRLCGKFAA